MTDWMIYGATGYTGSLIAEAAVACGHRPLLAGRSESKLKALAQRLDLDYVVFRVDSVPDLKQYDVRVILNCAGPFINTAVPMQQACLAAGVHYLDITVETTVFERTLEFDAEARECGIVMMSGVGFDTIPADCLASYVVNQVPDTTSLDIMLDLRLLRGELGFTSGTLKSIMGMLPMGIRVRRDGRLLSYDLGTHGKIVCFPDDPRRVVPVPCGDVCNIYHTTRIPNITCYIALPDWAWFGLRLGGRLAQFMLRNAALQRVLRVPIERLVHGPSEMRRYRSRALIGARASSADGTTKVAWVETAEPYQFSVEAALHTVEQVLARRLSGALTPSMAFGADYVLEIEGTRRWDS